MTSLNEAMEEWTGGPTWSCACCSSPEPRNPQGPDSSRSCLLLYPKEEGKGFDESISLQPPPPVD